MQDKKQQLELDMEQQTGPTLGNEFIKAVYCYLAHLTYMQNTSCEMLGWMNPKAEIKIAGRNINNHRYANDTTNGRKLKKNQEILYKSENLA